MGVEGKRSIVQPRSHFCILASFGKVLDCSNELNWLLEVNSLMLQSIVDKVCWSQVYFLSSYTICTYYVWLFIHLVIQLTQLANKSVILMKLNGGCLTIITTRMKTLPSAKIGRKWLWVSKRTSNNLMASCMLIENLSTLDICQPSDNRPCGKNFVV